MDSGCGGVGTAVSSAIGVRSGAALSAIFFFLTILAIPSSTALGCSALAMGGLSILDVSVVGVSLLGVSVFAVSVADVVCAEGSVLRVLG